MYLTKYVTMYKLNDNNTLLLNALSGAIDIVDNATKDVITNIQNSSSINGISDDALIETLKKRSYLFNNKEEEQIAFQRQRQIEERYSNDNIGFVICPTMACNLRCTYCFESEEIRRQSEVMSVKQVENIFKLIEVVKKERNLMRSYIELFGGEPLLPSTLEINQKILEYAKNNAMIVNIISNGINISLYKQFFEEYKDIISIQITLDGLKEIHDKRRIRIDSSGTFDCICSGIELLLDIGIKTNVRVNVDRDNIGTLKKFTEYIDQKGWKENKVFHCDIAPVTNHHIDENASAVMPEHEIVKQITKMFPNYSPETSYFRLTMFRVLNHINKSLNLASNKVDFSLLHFCEANVLQFYVFSPDGYIYACPETIGKKDLAIGTFYPEISFIDEKVNMWKDRNIFRMPKCMDCKIATFCGGGCAYAAYNVNQNIDCPVCNDAENILTEYIDSIKDYIVEKYVG